MSQTWQKACDCKNATATRGRIVYTQGVNPDGATWASAKHHPGPVCDSCDTPWTLVPARLS